MAEKAWYFPSSTGNYSAPSGDYRIKIWYTDASAYNKDMTSGIISLGDLKIPLEVDTQNSQFRFSSMKITFQNLNDEFETEALLDEQKQNEIFVDIYRDGSLFFQGMLDFAKNEKIDWHFSGSGFNYRNITLTVIDRIAYFWRNAKTLDDVSYTEALTIEDLFTNIKNMISITNLSFDSGLKFQEYAGVEYALADLYIARQGTSTLISDFLKKFVVALGCFVFTLNGNFYVVSRASGADRSIARDEIKELSFIEKAETIQNILMSTTLDYEKDSEFDVFGDIIGFSQETLGSQSGAEIVDLLIDGTGIIDEIFSTTAENEVGPTTGDVDDDAFNDPMATWITDELESGDVLTFVGPDQNYMIKEITSETDLTFYGGGLSGTRTYIISQLSTLRRYKIHHVAALAFQNYSSFFLTSPHLLKIKLAGLDWDITKKFWLTEWKYRARDAVFSFDQNDATFEMRAVGAVPDIGGSMLDGVPEE